MQLCLKARTAAANASTLLSNTQPRSLWDQDMKSDTQTKPLKLTCGGGCGSGTLGVGVHTTCTLSQREGSSLTSGGGGIRRGSCGVLLGHGSVGKVECQGRAGGGLGSGGVGNHGTLSGLGDTNVAGNWWGKREGKWAEDRGRECYSVGWRRDRRHADVEAAPRNRI